MMNTQITTSASGSPADSGVSGVLKGQEQKGGLFAILMQAFQSHLKVGAALSADGKVQGKGDAALASLLQGKHGAEISALLAKLGQGDAPSDGKLLKSLSAGALAALKQALLQQPGTKPSGDGSVDLVAQIKSALEAMSANDSKPSDAAKRAQAQDDGSSLQVGLVAAGVHVNQSKLTTGGIKQQADASADSLAGDLAGSKGAGAKSKKKLLIGMGKQGEQLREKDVAGKASSKQVAAAKVARGVEKGVESQVATEQAVTAKGAVRDAVTNAVAGPQRGARQDSTGQVASGTAVNQAVAGDATRTASVQASAMQEKGGLDSKVLSAKGMAVVDPAAQKQDTHGNPLYSAVVDPSAKSKVVTIAKASDDGVPQDDGVSLAALRSNGAAAVHLSANTDGTASRINPQALLATQGNHQQGGAGDQGSQSKQQSSQGAFDGLVSDLRSDARTAARGAEFATQLSYKSASTWKPADAMLQIGRAAADGTVRFDLQLEPAHLGKVTVSIQSDAAKQVQLHITVDNVAGRMALDQNMGQLRAALAQQGLDLSGFSMNLSSQGRQGQGDGHGSGFTRGQQGGFRIASDTVQVENNLVAEAGINRAGAGRLSILA